MDDLRELATTVAEAARPHADRHDRDGSFVAEGVTTAKEVGYLAAPVPDDLGGAGALTAEVTDAQRIIAAACPSTALACAMHLHVVLAAAWRWRRGDTVVEKLLRRVGDDRIIVASTGGNDWTKPTATATPVDGGWRVSGRKTFASLAPVADVAATFAVIGEPAPGAEVIAFGLPLAAEGVRVEETWDAAGMRGTGSHDLVLEDVFVAEGQVTARRTWGELDRPLLVASVHAWPVVYATYLGVAEAVVDAAVASHRPGAASARLVGAADAALRVGRWALHGALAELGDNPEPTAENFVLVQQMKRTITLACEEIAPLVAELAGGGAYARRGQIDRMLRDVRAATYHPYPRETTLVHAGQLRLGTAFEPV